MVGVGLLVMNGLGSGLELGLKLTFGSGLALGLYRWSQVFPPHVEGQQGVQALVADPSQSLPPWAGAGFVQLRVDLPVRGRSRVSVRVFVIVRVIGLGSTVLPL